MRPRKTPALLYSRKAHFKQRNLWRAVNDRKEMLCQKVYVLLGRKQKIKRRRNFVAPEMTVVISSDPKPSPLSAVTLDSHCSQQAGTGLSSTSYLIPHEPSLHTRGRASNSETTTYLWKPFTTCQCNCQRTRVCLTSLGLRVTACHSHCHWGQTLNQ